MLIVIRVSDSGAEVAGDTHYDTLFRSNDMPYKKTTFTTSVLPLVNNESTEFRIFAAGSIDYYTIQFIPNYSPEN